MSGFDRDAATVPLREGSSSTFRRLLVVVTGSPSAADMPACLYVLRQLRPELQIRVVLTRSAARFVTPTALQHRVVTPVLSDSWETTDTPVHVELAAWAEAALVMPATLDYLSRLARGGGDSPSVLALQCTAVPVVVAPGLPPGAVEGPAYRAHWEALTARPNTAVLPPVEALSVGAGETFVGAPGPIDEALDLLEHLAARPGDRSGQP